MVHLTILLSLTSKGLRLLQWHLSDVFNINPLRMLCMNRVLNRMPWLPFTLNILWGSDSWNSCWRLITLEAPFILANTLSTWSKCCLMDFTICQGLPSCQRDLFQATLGFWWLSSGWYLTPKERQWRWCEELTWQEIWSEMWNGRHSRCSSDIDVD